MPFAEDLLEQATHLARREPRRPRQASLRRAVSTAYYALFHFLIAETARNWRRTQDREKLARMFDHDTMKRACVRGRDRLQQRVAKEAMEDEARANAKQLAFVADTFVKMQQQRHLADYDGSMRWTRTDVLAQLDSVSQAFENWKAIRQQDLAQDFLPTLLIKERN